MNYTLNQLRIFLKIVQTQSITKAAEELHLTQPAVSIQLKNFQEQFEIPLTEIVGKKIFITDFGNEVGKAAESIIDEVYAINHKVNAYKGFLTGRLKLSVASTGKYVIPYFLSPFLKKYQNIELMLDVTNKTKVIESLVRGEVDFALVSVLPEKSAAYATRHMAKNAVAAGLCDEILVQVSYAIGVAKPCGLYVNTYGTSKVDKTDGEIAEILSEIFDMRPYFIEQRLKLRNPIYQETAAYGHMGRKNEVVTKTFKSPDGTIISKEVELFTWEKLDFVDKVKAAFNI
jgi:hypothetical protein